MNITNVIISAFLTYCDFATSEDTNAFSELIRKAEPEATRLRDYCENTHFEFDMPKTSILKFYVECVGMVADIPNSDFEVRLANLCGSLWLTVYFYGKEQDKLFTIIMTEKESENE